MLCPTCGQEVSGNFCSFCGTGLTTETQSQPSLSEEELRERQLQIVREWQNSKQEAGIQTRTEKKNVRKKDSADAFFKGYRKEKTSMKKIRTVKLKPEQEKQTQKENTRHGGRYSQADTPDRGGRYSRADMSDRRGRYSQADIPDRRDRYSQADTPDRRSRYHLAGAGPHVEQSEWEETQAADQTLWPNAGEEEQAHTGLHSRRNTESRSRQAGRLVLQGAVGVLVAITRILQLVSCLAMAGMTVCLAHSFWNGRGDLGSIYTAVSDRNYSLILYVTAAGLVLLFGLIFCFWILTRKDGGGDLRLKSYDTGRGFLPFLLALAGIAAFSLLTPYLPADGSVFHGLGKGILAVSAAVLAHKDLLLRLGGLGLILSLIRKILRV